MKEKILPRNKIALKVYTQNRNSLYLAGIDKLFATYKNKKTHVLHALFENISSSFLLSLNSSSHTKRIYVQTPSTFLPQHKPNSTTRTFMVDVLHVEAIEENCMHPNV